MPMPTPVTPAYLIAELSASGTSSEANAINSKGQIVGWTQYEPGHRRAFLWQNNVEIANLGALGGAKSEALALNENGQIVGRADTAERKSVAFVWQDYVMRRVALSGDGDSAATGINAKGQIVGYRNVRLVEKVAKGMRGKRQQAIATSRAFLWKRGTITDLYEVGVGGFSAAAGINAAGKVVGSSAPGNLNGGVFVWTQPGKWDFSDYVHRGGLRGATGTAINDAGDVVGSGMVWNDSQDHIRVHAFLRTSRETLDLGGFGEGSTRALALNNRGQVVGTAFVMQGNGEQSHRAFLWQNRTLTNLNDAIKINSGWTLEEARGINDKGQIVGVGTYERHRRAFLLTPVSAASSINTAPMGTSVPAPKTPNERLYEGARQGDIGRMQAALRDGANINAQFDSTHETALMAIMQLLSTEPFAFLMRHKPDLSLRDEGGDTVLHYAAADIPYNVDDIKQVGSEETYLRLAASRRLRIMQKLLAEGMDVNACDDQGMTPLMVLVSRDGETLPRLALLARHGAKLNTQNKNGATALHLAAENYAPTNLAALLRLRANPNVRDSEGRTPLMLARAEYEHCKLLIDGGANVNLCDKAGRTLLLRLWEDAANSHVEAHSDNEGELHPEVVHLPDENIMRLLIRRGANVNTRDNHGKTALQWAQELVEKCKEATPRRQAEHFGRLLQKAGAHHANKELQGERTVRRRGTGVKR